jgi:hypothetical protein
MDKEDKEKYGSNGRKYCKKLPYMFTPAMYQLLLLVISKDEEFIGRVEYPIVMEKIAEL